MDGLLVTVAAPLTAASMSGEVHHPA
eukprot:COSAG06_NODE_4342_length_4354_cov_84.610150_5_plen_25_part_01